MCDLAKGEEGGQQDLQAMNDFLSSVSRFSSPLQSSVSVRSTAVLFLSSQEGCRMSYEFASEAEATLMYVKVSPE